MKLLKCPTGGLSAYDVVIVGSGLSGCLVASRVLKKNPSAKIAILEEGSIPVSGLFAEAPFLASYIPLLPWTRSMCSTYSSRHGRVVGGSCTIAEGPFVVKGLGDEFNEISAVFGSTTIKNYAKYYSEVMSEPCPVNHQKNIPLDMIPIVFPTLRQLNSDINGRFQQACESISLRSLTEAHSDCDGYAPSQAMLRGGKRFLPTDLIKYLNVDLFVETFAKSLSFSESSNTVNGVLAQPSGSKKSTPITISAPEIILCAGGVGTPSLLLRSGVGPKSLLKKCKVDLESLGQSVIEAPRFPVEFNVEPLKVSKTISLQTASTAYKHWREYSSAKEGPFLSFAEWQAFVRTSDELHRPNARFTLVSALRNGLPVLNGEGFTLNIDLTETNERGKIVPVAPKDGEPEHDSEWDIQYQYSYSSDSSLSTMDEAILFGTMLCDCSSNIEYRVCNTHPFKSLGSRGVAPELEAPETTRELVRAMVTGSGDVYGACPMGTVVDPNTLQIKGLSNVRIGDVSVIPIPMMANKLALGQITACMVADSL